MILYLTLIKFFIIISLFRLFRKPIFLETLSSQDIFDQTNNWFFLLPEIYFFIFVFFIFIFIMFVIIPYNSTYYFFSKFILILFLMFFMYLFYLFWNNLIYYNIFDFSINANNLSFLSKFLFIFFLIIFFWIFKNYLFIKNFFISEFYLLFALSILGLFLILSSNNFLTFYLSLELYSLSIYGVMVIIKNSLIMVESAIKYFIVSSFSSGLIIFGISILYFFTGCINFYDLNLFTTAISCMPLILPNKIYYFIGLFLIILGLLIKISSAPFHIWYVDIYANTLQILNLYFLILPKFVFLSFLLKIYLVLFIDFFFFKFFFFFFFFSCLIFGVFGAIYQTNMKKIFFYSSVFNLAFFFVLFNFINVYSLIIFYLFSFIYFISIFGNFIFLLLLINFSTLKFYKNLNSIVNLFSSYPSLSCYASFLFLSSAGFPPFLGFLNKFLVFLNLINLNFYFIFVFLFVFSIIAFFYYIRFIKLVFINSHKNYIFLFPQTFGNSFLIVIFTFFNIFFYFFFLFIMDFFFCFFLI